MRVNPVRTRAVTTTSSSMRAAEYPSAAGQYVSSANTMPVLISIGRSSETRREPLRLLTETRHRACRPYNSCSLGGRVSATRHTMSVAENIPFGTNHLDHDVCDGRTDAAIASLSNLSREHAPAVDVDRGTCEVGAIGRGQERNCRGDFRRVGGAAQRNLVPLCLLHLLEGHRALVRLLAQRFEMHVGRDV